MISLKQPLSSNLCGQTVVAMVAETSIEAVCHVMGKHGLTRTRDLVRALRYYGVRTPKRLVRVMDTIEMPMRCIVKARRPDGKRSHWMLKWDDTIHDPDALNRTHCPWPITSYLPILDSE